MTIQVNLCCLLHVSLRFGTKFTWIVVIKIFAINPLPQPFLGCHLEFHIFFHNGLLGGHTHFFYSLTVSACLAVYSLAAAFSSNATLSRIFADCQWWRQWLWRWWLFYIPVWSHHPFYVLLILPATELRMSSLKGGIADYFNIIFGLFIYCICHCCVSMHTVEFDDCVTSQFLFVIHLFQLAVCYNCLPYWIMFGELLTAESRLRRRDAVALENIYRMEMVYLCTNHYLKKSPKVLL